VQFYTGTIFTKKKHQPKMSCAMTSASMLCRTWLNMLKQKFEFVFRLFCNCWLLTLFGLQNIRHATWRESKASAPLVFGSPAQPHHTHHQVGRSPRLRGHVDSQTVVFFSPKTPPCHFQVGHWSKPIHPHHTQVNQYDPINQWILIDWLINLSLRYH